MNPDQQTQTPQTGSPTSHKDDRMKKIITVYLILGVVLNVILAGLTNIIGSEMPRVIINAVLIAVLAELLRRWDRERNAKS